MSLRLGTLIITVRQYFVSVCLFFLFLYYYENRAHRRFIYLLTIYIVWAEIEKVNPPE